MKTICISITGDNGRVLYENMPVIADNKDLKFVENYGRQLYLKTKGARRLTYWDGEIETVMEVEG